MDATNMVESSMSVQTTPPYQNATDLLHEAPESFVTAVDSQLNGSLDCLGIYTPRSLDVLFAAGEFSAQKDAGQLPLIAKDASIEIAFGDTAREHLYELGQFAYAMDSYTDGSVLRVGLTEQTGLLVVGTFSAAAVENVLSTVDTHLRIERS